MGIGRISLANVLQHVSLTPVLRWEDIGQNAKGFYPHDNYVQCFIAPGYFTSHYQERRFELVLVAFVHFGEDHQRNVAELVFQSDKYRSAQRPLPSDNQPGRGHLGAVAELRDVLAAAYIHFETGAQHAIRQARYFGRLKTLFHVLLASLSARHSSTRWHSAIYCKSVMAAISPESQRWERHDFV